MQNFTYRTFPPPPELADDVRFFWMLESNASPNKPYIHRSMADGCAELIFHYKGRFDEVHRNGQRGSSFTSGIHGQSRRYRRFVIDSNFGIFGAYLYPHALPRLFNIPATEVSGQMPDLHGLLAREGTALEEQVMLASTPYQRLKVLSSFLLARLKRNGTRPDTIRTSIHAIIRSGGQVNIQELASHYCLSLRQFERRFKVLAGFNPKLYSRIVRFQSVFREFEEGNKHLSAIAHQCGYYDQSHFIEDFREFSGFNPRQFLHDQSSEGIIWSP